jgi:gas vesicle protein
MKAGIGFLVGVSVGAGLGMIFASQSGKQTRAAIRRTAQESLDAAASGVAKAGSRFMEAAEKGKEKAAEALETGKEAYRSQVAGA